MGDASDKTLRRAGRETVIFAKRHAPVGRTGKLANSIRATTIKKGPRRHVIKITVGPVYGSNGKNYAKFVTQGTGIHGPLHRPIVAANHTGNGGPFRFEPAGRRLRRVGANAERAVVRGGSGQFVYAKVTRGQRPNNFLVEALRDTAAVDPRIRLVR